MMRFIEEFMFKPSKKTVQVTSIRRARMWLIHSLGLLRGNLLVEARLQSPLLPTMRRCLRASIQTL